MSDETTENIEQTEATESTETGAPEEEAAPEEGEDGVSLSEENELDDNVVEFVDESSVAEIRRLEAVVEELQGRLRAVSAAYQKQQGEIAATRDRLERQAAVKEELRRGEVVGGLFEPVENLRRSIDAARKGASTEDTVMGLELILKAFMQGFEKLGLEEVPGKGAPFDPNIHEALTAIPVPDPSLDQVVMDVFSVGYRIGSRLIAPAKVIVGAYQEPAGEA